MADFNQRFLAYVKGLRETNEAARPTQALDSTTEVKKDLQTVRNLNPTWYDLNTSYYKGIA